MFRHFSAAHKPGNVVKHLLRVPLCISEGGLDNVEVFTEGAPTPVTAVQVFPICNKIGQLMLTHAHEGFLAFGGEDHPQLGEHTHTLMQLMLRNRVGREDAIKRVNAGTAEDDLLQLCHWCCLSTGPQSLLEVAGASPAPIPDYGCTGVHVPRFCGT